MHVRPADFYLTHEVQPGNWKLATPQSTAWQPATGNKHMPVQKKSSTTEGEAFYK
jgi:hypothetical protein